MRRPWEITPVGLIGLVVLAAGGVPRAVADQWSVAPTFAFWVDRDTNRNLVPDGTPSEGTAMSVDMQLQYATERLTLSLHPQAVLQRFSSNEFPDANDFLLGGTAGWLTERSTWGLTGLLSDQNLTTTELPNTGIVEPGTRRTDEELGLSWNYAQSPTRSLLLQANYSHVLYRSDSTLETQTTLQSYRGATFSATEQFQHSDRLGTYLSLSGATFLQQGLPDTEHTYGATVGFKSQLSERTTLSADGGLSRTTLLSLTSNGLLYDFSLSRATSTGSFGITASRNVAPAGFGEITQQDTLKVTAHRDLSERLSFDGSVGGIRYSGVFKLPGIILIDLSSLDRTYAQGALGLTWRAGETWSVGVRTYYSWLRGTDVPTADGWQVRLESVWTPNPRSVSR